MKNLVGVWTCDEDIEKELKEAGIEVVKISKGKTEVPYTLIGRLGSIKFERAWYYWMVKCRVPLTVAKEMHADVVGRKDIRVVGHCGCPPPEDWVSHDGFINSYHIDSQAGLNLFAKIMKKYNLV